MGAEFSVASLRQRPPPPNVLYCRYLSWIIVAGVFYGRTVRVCEYTHLLLLSHVCFIFTPLHTFQHCPGTIPRSSFVVPDAPSLDWRKRFAGSAAGPRLRSNTCRVCRTGRMGEDSLARRHRLATVSTAVPVPGGNDQHSGRMCSSPLDWHSAGRYAVAQNCGHRNSFPR